MNRSTFSSTLALFVGVAVVGTGLAVGNVYFAAAVTGVVCAIPLLLMPIEYVLWGGWILTFLMAGQLQYFAHIDKAFWLPYLFGLFLFVRLPIDLMTRRTSAGPAISTANSVKTWILIFFAIAIFSTAINASPLKYKPSKVV